ncbi:hypothetical protein U1P98_07470 [Lysinibacillus irui]|uniref:Virion structural protein n=1 Tax=Lysinibacillus irui TaxID=2998077 RepID=A0ABU5NJB6_9BACI|nr:hypothetical protein [Lysinibacillus irui]MEA0553754.1 hypothetical protein [Lysinibacillus irui]MEA0976138.1 hypothetical protein [Lysinibacillus irui]MEA1042292.1 hypothetical protein [Lysinibacillus irui]
MKSIGTLEIGSLVTFHDLDFDTVSETKGFETTRGAIGYLWRVANHNHFREGTTILVAEHAFINSVYFTNIAGRAYLTSSIRKTLITELDKLSASFRSFLVPIPVGGQNTGNIIYDYISIFTADEINASAPTSALDYDTLSMGTIPNLMNSIRPISTDNEVFLRNRPGTMWTRSGGDEGAYYVQTSGTPMLVNSSSTASVKYQPIRPYVIIDSSAPISAQKYYNVWLFAGAHPEPVGYFKQNSVWAPFFAKSAIKGGTV